MERISISTTDIYIEPIEPCPDGRRSRRQREKEAVGRIAMSLGIAIGHDPDGAPVTDGSYISVSHSIGLAVVALDRCRPIGIDAEDWRPALRRVRAKFLSEAEMERVSDDGSLLMAWTAKEAVYKAMPVPRAPMTRIECNADFTAATADGLAYGLTSWLHGTTRITLAAHDAD